MPAPFGIPLYQEYRSTFRPTGKVYLFLDEVQLVLQWEQFVYPHSFRHRFAKNFLERYNDIALLADLMGHESIETTRIYLRRTANEQRQIVDKVVNR